MDEKDLDKINIEYPNKNELELILNLLDEKINSKNNKSYVVAQEFHPEAGYSNRIVTLKFAQNQYNQRQSAPFVLSYFTREYYQKRKTPIGNMLNQF